ncbi:MAG: hypothetical protein ACHQX1_03450 [Candidatus Micrarchaeales archaeon]
MKNHSTMKAQSAMEYLMTYGWAILVIAVVLGALYQLGIFNAANILGTSCVASPGYLCKSATLTSASQLTFVFGQNIGSTMYNVQLACAATASTTGLPLPGTAFNSISATGAVLPPSSTGNALSAGSTITISALPCYGTTGSIASNLAIGSGYSGFIWANYTTQSTAEVKGTNPWLTAKIITIRVGVS